MVTLLHLAACSVPWLIGLTSRCFAHSARFVRPPPLPHPQFAIVVLHLRTGPQFSMVVPLRSQARLWHSLLHWAYFGLFPPLAVAFVRPSPSAARCSGAADALWACPRTSSRFAAFDCASRGAAACKAPLLIGPTTACFAHCARPSCAPHQFPLKSCGFSSAETARKRFLLWKMKFSATKIAPSPPYTPPGTIEARKGFTPLLGYSQSIDKVSEERGLNQK